MDIIITYAPFFAISPILIAFVVVVTDIVRSSAKNDSRVDS
jgi:hypothetical protein